MWLLIAVLSYFLLAIVALFDRYFLVGPISNPKVYTFYVGAIGLLACLFLLPFGINLISQSVIFLGIITGLVRLLAILFLSIATTKSEISRVIPANGALLPIFSFFLFFFFFPQTGTLDLTQVLGFILLIIGSVLISLKKGFSGYFSSKIFFKYLFPTSFFFALTFFLSKNLYLKTSFINGLFLMLVGCALGAIFLLIFSEVRKEVFTKKPGQKISTLFILGQLIGGGGIFLQQYAIFLAKPEQVPFINALEGLRYAFLLFFVFIVSVKNPNILKEEIGGSAVINKIFAVLLIGIGLIILAFKL
jgi:drug/metabolite transporter (DMT)-like permease